MTSLPEDRVCLECFRLLEDEDGLLCERCRDDQDALPECEITDLGEDRPDLVEFFARHG